MGPCCLWDLDAYTSLLSATISATHRAADSLSRRLWLPFSGTSASCLLAPVSLCCHLLSTSAFTFTSASSRISASRHTSASCRAPLIWLVVAFPGASASPSRRASIRRLSLRHSSSSHLYLSPHPSFLVGFCIAWRLTPPPVSTPLGAASRRNPTFRLVCCIAWRLGLPYGWLSCCHSSHLCLLCIYASCL